MDLKDITLSEISQMKKDKYYMIFAHMGNIKSNQNPK